MKVGQFNQKISGKDWFVGFIKRNPTFSIRKPEKLSLTRARMTNPEKITKYFHDLGEIIRNLGLESKHLRAFGIVI